jgi:predicted subunit of tRNA(5-methylaminomethyl-2-thiouridylate) methyltransferase
MFKVFIDGNDDRLRLEDLEGRKVGWIRGHTIGFGGLPSEKIALRAVPEAWMALEMTLQRGYPGYAPRPVKKSNIDMVHDGAYEWVADGFRPLARLIRPHTARNSEQSFALEFLVPSYATQHVTIAAAEAVWQVLSDYIPVRTDDVSRQAFTSDQELDSAALAVGGR